MGLVLELSFPLLFPLPERHVVNESTKLVDLCVKEKHTIVRQGCTKSLKDCLIDMDVDDLKGYTEETLKKHVEGKGGPDGRVSGWLEENQLWRFLRGYVSPIITKKAKDGDNSSSNSSASPSKRPS